MKQSHSLNVLVACFAFLFSNNLFAQTSFAEPVKAYTKNAVVSNKLEDSLKQQFKEKKLTWPPQAVYIRSFKYDRMLELWVKSKNVDSFTLFKSYKVCMESGSIGPKRAEGDNQVPEGFYYINEFNPRSTYHLALGLNYPNASDKVLSDPKNPGGDIYIHGNCVSVGCIAIQDMPIEEVYTLASVAKTNGQDFIPVHIYPVNYGIKKSLDYLTSAIKGKQAINKSILNVKAVFDYFEKRKKLPVILVNNKGDYMLN
jgi:murein L,D-transpeptidase YafK